jgi:hypothetical protein
MHAAEMDLLQFENDVGQFDLGHGRVSPRAIALAAWIDASHTNI